MLPREMFRKNNKTIRIKIGQLIPHEKFDKSFLQWEWADKVRKYVYDLQASPINKVNF